MMFIDINGIATLNNHGVDYYCIIIGISKREAINVLRNADLSENSRSLWNIKIFHVYKMNEETITFGDIEIKCNFHYQQKHCRYWQNNICQGSFW